MLERIDFGVGGGERDAGLEARQPEVVEVAHGFSELIFSEHHGDDGLNRLGWDGAGEVTDWHMERRGHDADDSVGIAIERDSFADYGWIRAERMRQRSLVRTTTRSRPDWAS